MDSTVGRGISFERAIPCCFQTFRQTGYILAPDQVAYEEVYSEVSKIFPMTRKFFTDAEEYDIFGMPVTFWRTIKTSANSMNYFTDGTISDSYFVVEGYLKNRKVDN